MHLVRLTQFTPTPLPKVKSIMIESTDQIQCKNINLRSTLTKSLPIQVSVNQFIVKTMSYLTLPPYAHEF